MKSVIRDFLLIFLGVVVFRLPGAILTARDRAVVLEEEMTDIFQPRYILSPEESKLAERVGFPPDILPFITHVGIGELKQAYGTNQFDHSFPITGVEFAVRPEWSLSTMKTLRAVLEPRGYQVFRTERSRFDFHELTVVETTDPFAIVKLRHTTGDDLRLHARILAKLYEWDSRYGIQVIGADYDWVEIEFRTLPPDLSAFFREAAAFCPYPGRHYASTAEETIADLQQSKMLYLKWE